MATHEEKESEKSTSLSILSGSSESTLTCQHGSPTKGDLVVKYGCLGGWYRPEVLCRKCGNELEYMK